jgi:acyl transferase domain-containing protein/SAM-dependent methyltransferase
VSKRADLAAVLESIQALPPLGGVVHLAGCLDDGVVSDLNPQRFARVLAPKAIGAWHLHELTAGLPLDFFVLFSSTAAVLGSPGQANYAAANAFLGALAWRRTSEGLPATNINWGPWSEAGMAASLEPGQKRRVGTAGIRELAPASGVAVFLRAIATGTPEITVIDADWNRLVESGRSDDVPSLIADLVKRPAAGSQAAAGTPMPADLVAGLAAMPPARRRGALQTHIRDQVMQVLGLAAADGFDPQQGLRDLGMDSLMAVELRNRLQRSIGRPLPSTLAFDCPTVEALTAYLANDVLKLLPAASAAIEPERRALDVRADEPIAIVGLGVRLPGDVDTPERFWHVLRNGVDTITEVPASRWNVDDYYDPDPARPGKMYTRHGGFLKEVDRFDAAFFGISRREAVSLDPQQRLLLEVSWEALERAGLAPETLVGSRSGVFVGISTNDYGQILARLGDPSRLDAYVGTGNSLSVAAGRLSYVLGLQGPCMSIDTACSSSLLAVHLAASALRNGECDMALAGGVNLTLTPDLTINFCRARMLSADGRCKTFDAEADGYVRSEGAGVVVLKRLSDALAAGNRILAVVRGSAVNQDGRSSGLTVPNGPAQQTLLREALANAGVRPDEVTYLEAHGTGTSLGDPIEMQALAAVFGADRDPGRPLVVGSIKTNMGHLEAAAGIAGLAKVVLSLQHGEIPPHLHLNTLNPHITLGDAPIVVPREPMPWPTAAERRIGGVSSFGFSGTNVHVVLESAPVEPERAADRRPAHLAVVSAKSEEGLAANSAQLADWLERNPGAGIGDVAHTLGTGRSHFAHRAAIVARSADDLESALRAIAAGSSVPGLLRGTFESDEGPHTAFLFTGQGSQYAGMGRRLYELEPIFKAALDECDAMLAPELGRSILEVMHGAGGDSSLTDTGFTQPALFALEYALARMWRSWGVHPVAVMGHSLGEYVAACVAGVFSLQDGLRLAAARGRLMQALEAPGAMAALMADEDRVSLALRPHAARVSIAAVNGPGNTVISGAAADVDALVSQMASVGVRAARLDVSHAFHSPLMDPMLEEFERVLAGVTFAEPGLAVISNVTGRVAEPGTLSSPAYWLRHVREAVRFSDGVAALHEQGCRMFVEIGPSPTLLGMARRMAGNPAAIWLPSLRKGRDDWEQVLESIAAMYIAGVRIDWAAFDRAHGCRTVQLPTYAFQRQRYWADEAPTPRPKPAADVFERVETAARQQSLEGPLDLALHTYGGKWRSLERLTTAYIVKALRNLGAFCAPGDRHTVDSFMTRCGVLAVYRRLVARWMTRLASEGLLTTEADGFGVGAPLLEPDLDRLWAEATDLADVPQVKEWMRRSGAALAGVITGRESAVETLFPGGSMDMAEGLYERSAPSRYINGIARAAVHAQISAHGTPRTGRVLELGAGTGGTTSALLTALEQANVEYWFTDLSEFFLTRAKAKFSRFDFVRYALLDIEKRPSDQGYPEHAFDVVLAANVLHATTNLRRTIEHARALVAPGGVLVLCEDTTYHSYLDVTIALMEGWQRFDDDLRTDQPLLPVEAWDRALQEAGFDRVAAYPGADSPAAIIGQSVIIARAPVAGEAADDDAVEQLARRIETPPVEGVADAAAAERGEALRRRLAEAVPSEQDEILVEFVRGHVAAVLRLDPSEVPERRRRLMDLGLDSLMAVELRNRFAAELGAEPTIPATLMFDYPTIDAIAAFLREGMLGPMEERAAPPAPESSEAAAALAGLSDEEVEALLIQKLESL